MIRNRTPEAAAGRSRRNPRGGWWAALAALLLSWSAPAPATAQEDPGPLAGTSWLFVEFVSMSDEVAPTRPPPGRIYAMSLGEDGTAALRLDCRWAVGPWSARESGLPPDPEPAHGSGAGGAKRRGGSFHIGPLTLTEAPCPPPGVDAFLAAQLGYVRSFTLLDGRLFLSLFADGGIMEWAPAFVAPEDGGPRNWRVRSQGPLPLRAEADPAAGEIGRVPGGALLDNLGCVETETGFWCDVQPLGGGPRGFVPGAHLQAAVAPDGVPHFGPDDSALRAGQGDFDARGTLSCQADGQAPGECPFGVARGGGGYATVVVERPDGGRRALHFRMGIPIGADLSQADGDLRFEVERRGDEFRVRAGPVIYRVFDAVVLGG